MGLTTSIPSNFVCKSWISFKFCTNVVQDAHFWLDVLENVTLAIISSKFPPKGLLYSSGKPRLKLALVAIVVGHRPVHFMYPCRAGSQLSDKPKIV